MKIVETHESPFYSVTNFKILLIDNCCLKYTKIQNKASSHRFIICDLCTAINQKRFSMDIPF